MLHNLIWISVIIINLIYNIIQIWPSKGPFEQYKTKLKYKTGSVFCKNQCAISMKLLTRPFFRAWYCLAPLNSLFVLFWDSSVVAPVDPPKYLSTSDPCAIRKWNVGEMLLQGYILRNRLHKDLQFISKRFIFTLSFVLFFASNSLEVSSI